MSFFFMIIIIHFYINGVAISLALKRKLGGNSEWPINCDYHGKVDIIYKIKKPIAAFK